jgi:hypothetical protein
MGVVDDVAFDGAERRAEAADDAGLFAVRDRVVADHVVADVLAGPGDGMGMGAFDGFDVALGGVGRGVVVGIAVFAERDAGANRVADHVVLDDPALAPMRADQTNLLGGRRRPGRGGMAEREPAHGDEVPARLVGVKHGLAHVDLDLLLVGVHALELRPDRRVVSSTCANQSCGFKPRSFSVLVPALEHQAQRLDSADGLDPGVHGRPGLPVAGVPTAQLPSNSPSGLSSRIR